MRETVHVDLGARAYDVVIGPDLLAEAGARIAPLLSKQRVAVLTDETVAALHLGALQDGLAGQGIAMDALALPAGEATKGWPQFSRAVEWLLEQKVERRDVVIAFGGGVVGAAALMRLASLDILVCL